MQSAWQICVCLHDRSQRGPPSATRHVVAGQPLYVAKVLASEKRSQSTNVGQRLELRALSTSACRSAVTSATVGYPQIASRTIAKQLDRNRLFRFSLNRLLDTQTCPVDFLISSNVSGRLGSRATMQPATCGVIPSNHDSRATTAMRDGHARISTVR